MRALARDIGRTELEDWVSDTLHDGKSVRKQLSSGERVHVERAVPFVVTAPAAESPRTAAQEVAEAHTAYVIATSEAALDVATGVRDAMSRHFKSALLIEVREFDEDRLLDDEAPVLSPFEILVEHQGAEAAAEEFARAIGEVDVRYRRPELTLKESNERIGGPFLRITFAPIYCRPNSETVYPELRTRVVANVFDATLRAGHMFAKGMDDSRPETHRGYGRSVFVDAVRKLDEDIDVIASAFDFLLAVTPIDATAAWHRFKESGFEEAPRLHYRPLPLDTSDAKHRLHAISFRHLEDPVLYDLYREKQAEIDLQLSLMDARDTPKVMELSRALYGSVPDSEAASAQSVLDAATEGNVGGDAVEAAELARSAREMIDDYRTRGPFDCEVELRDDLPAGMMVTKNTLLISTASRVPRNRIHALLSHEIGVHLLTFCAGDVQGLRLFRSGLAGYEGMQEGLAVLGEYLVGGLTRTRRRTLAARTIGCHAMLDGASFVEVFRLLTRTHGIPERSAFTTVVRLFRSGGLAKDAIYLRGFLDVLTHIRGGKPLNPFWIGKVSAEHFPILVELMERGLLSPSPIVPAFLEGDAARRRLKRIEDSAGIEAVFQESG